MGDEDKFCGFQQKEQETLYNVTVFDLIATLAARVTATLKLSKHLFLFL